MARYFVRYTVVVLSLLCLPVSAIAAPGPDGFPYRGWQGARELTNGETRVVIIPSVGARVVVFSLRGQNVLLEDPSLNGQVLKPGDSWAPWNGSQPDTLSPGGGGNQLLNVWMGPYEVTQANRLYLKLRSLENKDAGLREEKEFILDRHKPLLTIKRRLLNTGSKPAWWSFWDRALVPAGSIGAAPVTMGNPLAPDGWAANKDRKYLPGAAVDANPSVTDEILLVHTTGKGAGAYFQARQGWLGAVVNGLFFKTEFDLFPKQEHPWPQGLNGGFFYADNRIELEPTSPLFDLEPGQSAEWTVRWTLQPFGDVPDDPAALVAKLTQISKRT